MTSVVLIILQGFQFFNPLFSYKSSQTGEKLTIELNFWREMNVNKMSKNFSFH